MNALQLIKSLADESRLQILALLRKQAYCVEDLAELTSLAESTVSAHLKKLQAAGLVYSVKQQYYSVYHLKTWLSSQAWPSPPCPPISKSFKRPVLCIA